MATCSALLKTSGFHASHCYRDAKVERNGKPYCKMHDPERVEAKRKSQNEKWEAEFKRKQTQWAEEDARCKAIHELCGHIATEDLGKYELKLKP